MIEDQGPLWDIVLNGIILRMRPWRKARDYRKIWNDDKNEFPLKTITRSQAEKLASTLEPLGRHLVVDWAMRYGNPSIASRIDAPVSQGCERILVMPLYPQYCAATTATVCDEVFRVLMRMRRQPAVRIAPPYLQRPGLYRVAGVLDPGRAVAPRRSSPRSCWPRSTACRKSSSTRATRTTASASRPCGCCATVLKFDDKKLMLTFQSRFGGGKWLEPATDKTVKKLAKSGVKNIAVITPGFSADCLETLEEIAVENAHIFKKNGGENFAAIPCLNDSAPGMLVIWQMALARAQRLDLKPTALIMPCGGSSRNVRCSNEI